MIYFQTYCYILQSAVLKNTLKRNIKIIILFLISSQSNFFLSFAGSNLWRGKPSIKWVKCGHNNFVEDKAWQWWFWNSPVRVYGCEIYLWEGSDMKWHFDSATYINQYHPNHVIHGFSLRAHPTNFKDTIPTIGFCLILPPWVRVHHFQIHVVYSLCYRSVYPKIFATPLVSIGLIIWIEFSIGKLPAKSQRW